MAAKKKVIVPSGPSPDSYPTVRLMKGVGEFRPRKMDWSRFAHVALNPYTMGIFAFYSLEVNNMSNMLAGGSGDILAGFQPPDHLVDAFRTAYKIISGRKGTWLAWSQFEGKYRQYTVNNNKVSVSYPYDAALIEWDKWFASTLPMFNKIHDMLTQAGCLEANIVSLPVEDLIHLTEEERDRLFEVVYEDERLGTPTL